MITIMSTTACHVFDYWEQRTRRHGRDGRIVRAVCGAEGCVDGSYSRLGWRRRVNGRVEAGVG